MWTSQTNRLNQKAMNALETAKVDQLRAALMMADPLVVLWSLIEIGLKEDARFETLLLDPNLIERWRMYNAPLQKAGEADVIDAGFVQNLETALSKFLSS